MIPPTVPAGEVTLRAWEPEEAALYVDLRDEVVLRFTTEPPTLHDEECRRNIVASRQDPNYAPFAICGPDGRPVGNLAVVRRASTVDLSYWLAPGGRGRGWAAAALRAATAWAFGWWPVEQAELEIDLANEPSMRVAQVAGYHRSGTRLTSACGGPAAIYRRSTPS